MNYSQNLPCFLPHLLLIMPIISLLCSRRLKTSLIFLNYTLYEFNSNFTIDSIIWLICYEKGKEVSYVSNNIFIMKITLDEE